MWTGSFNITKNAVASRENTMTLGALSGNPGAPFESWLRMGSRGRERKAMRLKLHHVNFCTTNVPAMDTFYRDVLGLEPEPSLAASRVTTGG